MEVEQEPQMTYRAAQSLMLLGGTADQVVQTELLLPRMKQVIQVMEETVELIVLEVMVQKG